MGQSLRILHVIQTLRPESGGPPISAVGLAATQAARGHTVGFVTSDPPGTAMVAGAEKLTVHRVGSPGLAELLHRGAVRGQLAEVIRSADVVHLQGAWDTLLMVAAVEAHRARVPYLFQPHGMFDPWSLAQKPWKKRLALALFLRRIINRSSGVIALNPDESAGIALLRFRVPTPLIPNGLVLADIDPIPGPDEFRTAHPVLGADPYVLFLSRLHYKKGLDYLADAFAAVAARHPTVRLVVAGPDDGERAAFEQRIAARGIGPRVYLPGPLYGRAKFAALAGAACFCLPSRQEGFSMAILEALACRAPVVISEGCHFPEVAQAGAGYVVPLTAEAVADALMRVLDDPNAATQMGASGRRLIEDRYTWDHCAAASEQAYLASRSGPVRGFVKS